MLGGYVLMVAIDLPPIPHDEAARREALERLKDPDCKNFITSTIEKAFTRLNRMAAARGSMGADKSVKNAQTHAAGINYFSNVLKRIGTTGVRTLWCL